MADAGIGEAVLLGAAMGGGSAALTGGDPLKGALFGALTGGAGSGIAGLFPGAAGGAALTPAELAMWGESAGAGASFAANPATFMGAGGTGVASLAPTVSNAAALSSSPFALTSPPLGSGLSALEGLPTGTETVSELAGINPAVGAPGTNLYSPASAAASATPAATVAGATPAATPSWGEQFMQGAGKFIKEPWQSIKDNKGKAAAAALVGALGAKPSMGGAPNIAGYDGPLSKFRYDPLTYQPYTYRPYADGGPVEQMSNANSVGANTGFPMADIAHGAYATPYQQPISRNVVTGPQDVMTDPFSGAPRMASGGKAAKAANPMEAIDNYMGQASSGGMADVLAKARAGDYNAMIALNKLRGTPNQNYADGGISNLGGYSDGGRLLRGPGDGVSDSIPASIGNRQPARLADGEFVVPARIVSELGNGSTDAGARQLYAMMDRVQKARGKTTGKSAVARNTKAAKYLPA
jgi:hypothetical protein